MISDGAVIACIDAPEKCRIPYMVVGSISTNLYAAPRSTQDADFVVALAADSLSLLLKELRPIRLPRAGRNPPNPSQ